MNAALRLHRSPASGLRSAAAVRNASADSKEAALIVVGLVVFALAIHHGILTTKPLAAADWGLVSNDWVKSLGPWPNVWDPTNGFGTTGFTQAFQEPFQAIWAQLATAGVGFNVQEKIFFFLPFAVLSVLAPWLLGRELLGSSRWAALSALIFATSTHLLLRGAVHMAIANAMCIGVLVFWADIRSKTRLSPRWAGATGLLLALEATYEIRIALLTIFCLFIKLGLELVAASSMRMRLRYVMLTTAPLLLLVATQLTWLIPLHYYTGNLSLPIASAPFPSVATLVHAFTARDPAWTDGVPVFGRSTIVPWEAYVLPLIAFSALLVRRVRLEILWLLLIALIAAFLTKEDLPPLSGVYTWLFHHLPGWDLYRDATKLSSIVAIGYAIAVPFAARAVWHGLRSKAPRVAAAACVGALLAIPVVQSVSAGVVVARGQLGEATRATTEPASFASLATTLDADPQRSIVAFVGGAVTWDSTTIHRFSVASVNHPELELTGTTHPFDPAAPDNDPLNSYCPGDGVPFCYLTPNLFPYLVHEFGVGYVVAPVGDEVGTIPSAIGRETIVGRITSIVGYHPRVIGTGASAIAVWKTPDPVPTVAASRWVAHVRGPTEALTAALPALQVLHAPSVFDDAHVAAAASLPDSIEVVPNVATQYNIPIGGSYVVVIPQGASTPTAVSVLGRDVPLKTLRKAGGATLAGPITLPSGRIQIGGLSDAPPLMVWTAATQTALGTGTEVNLASTASGKELLSFPAPRAPWVLVRQGYDRAWQLDDSDAHVPSGPLNAFHLDRVTRPNLTLRFATLTWEPVGLVAAALLSLSLVLVLATPRWRRFQLSQPGPIWISLGSSGWWLTVFGLVIVAVALVAQAMGDAGVAPSPVGVFSETSSAAQSDVFAAPVFYVGLAMAAFTLAIATSLVSTARDNARRRPPAASRSLPVAERVTSVSWRR